MTVIERFTTTARARPRRVVLPEGTDARVLSAARRLTDEAICKVTLLGAAHDVARAAGESGIALDDIDIVTPEDSPHLERFAEALEARNRKIDLAMAASMVSDPLIHAGLMVAEAHADAMIAGAANETGKVISAGLKTVGLAEGMSRLSSYFLMNVPDFMRSGPRTFIFADCAVNVDPDAEQLADIAIASAVSALRLLDEAPRIALLSFSTKGSARAEQVDKVTAALELIRERAPDLAVDGELQADAAFVPAVAGRKVKAGAGVAGQANVLIFPDLNSGNIGYKLVQYMANAEAIGPFFQGFAKPVCDLSRGCSTEDIFAATIIMLATAS
jgi:phosphate acetyltransferase